jgi:hypothetical protein
MFEKDEIKQKKWRWINFISKNGLYGFILFIKKNTYK